MERGEDHSDQPIGVLAIVRRVTAILCVPLVRSRRRQLLKTTKPRPDAKGGEVPFPLYPEVTQAASNGGLIRLVPHFDPKGEIARDVVQVLDPKGEIARDVVQVRICQLPQQFIDPEVRFRASAPKTL